MRHMYRTMFLALLAVLALSATAASSAEANECNHIEKKWTMFCVHTGKNEEVKEVVGEVAFAGGKSASHATIEFEDGWRYKITCNSVKENGVFHSEQAVGVPVGKNIIELGSCHDEGELSRNCEVAGSVVLGEEGGAAGLEGAITPSSGEFKLNAYPVSKGIKWGTLTIKKISGGGTCYDQGTYPIKSESVEEAKAGLPCVFTAMKTETVEQPLTCSGYKLEYSGLPLRLQIESDVTLSGTYAGDAWGLREK